MEVGRSIELSHKLALTLAAKSLYFEYTRRGNITGPQWVVTFYCIFLHHILEIKPSA